jgi:signal transduction histidine kinase
VEDHGEGIAPADLPKLFLRFSQLDTGNTRKAGGAGLGLSIVKALVEAHGGEVGVTSEPGTRTVFWFRLPTAPGLLVDPA